MDAAPAGSSSSRRRYLQDLIGEWIGQITGSNAGDVTIWVFDKGDKIDGTIEVSDRELGRTRFTFVGTRQHDQVLLRIAPLEAQEGVVTAPGTVTCKIQPDGALAGIWETEIGTAGKLRVQRKAAPMSFSATDDKVAQKSPRRSSMTPLWVISLFVSLCEVVAGLAVTQAQGGVQAVLTGFVVSFPVLVAAAFFAVLWKKPYVFYPPTEFGASTNVSEYVQAFAGPSHTQAAAHQQQSIGGNTAHATRTEVNPREPETTDAKVHAELISNVFKFFGFRRMRFSDISDANAQAVFNLGKYQGFNLFDGMPGIAFYGHFADLEPTEIIARVRFLLNNIDLSYHRVREQPESAQRDAAIRTLDRLRIHVLAPEKSPIDEICLKIEDYRPDKLATQVSLHRPSDIESFVRSEYESMGLS